MRYYEDLEQMESSVEKVETKESDILYDQITTIDDFYRNCENLKSDLETILELQSIGEDVTEAVKAIEDRFIYLIKEGKNKFNLSKEDIESIKEDIFNSKGKTR